jgi:phosphohistidine phosphatase
MKTLFLLRHASAESASSLDLNRDLNERGRNQAHALGTFIREKDLKFDLVLCSPAVRAQSTTELALAAAGRSCHVHYDERIYEASGLQLLEVVQELERDADGALLVGHNPGMEEVIKLLTGQVQPMSTATLARIDFSATEWSDVVESTATLAWIVNP